MFLKGVPILHTQKFAPCLPNDKQKIPTRKGLRMKRKPFPVTMESCGDAISPS